MTTTSSIFHLRSEETQRNSQANPQAEILICDAEPAHIDGAKRLADMNRHIFSFIRRAAFLDACSEGALIIALMNDEVVGFVRYHHRKLDQQTTLYDICVAESLRGMGIGGKMMAFMLDHCRTLKRQTVVLKCPSHLAANHFYRLVGFTCIDTVPGKRQNINIWRLNINTAG